MAFILAKHWGVMPHVIWRYPFRYFKELRDQFIEDTKPRDDDADDDFDWEDESITGPQV
jgi:hypothetical protein